MSQHKKALIVFLMLTVLFSTLTYPLFAKAAQIDEEELTAAAAIIIDFETNQELYSYNADTPRPPASMTKMMLVYLVYEAIENGDLSFDTKVSISDAAHELAADDGYTNVPLEGTQTYTVDELLDAVIVVSACGATLALAEHVGGSNKGFLDMMNAKAAEWGIDAEFYNVYGGLDEEKTTLISARAMATIVRNSILKYPEILSKTSKQKIVFGEEEYRSTNRLLGEFEGMDGFKTGFTRAAGACLAATAKRDGTRIITVVMGTPSNAERSNDITMLLEYGFIKAGELRTQKPEAPDTEIAASDNDDTILPSVFFDRTRLNEIAELLNNSDDLSDNLEENENNTPPKTLGGGFWFFAFVSIIVVSLCIISFVTSYIRK